MSKSERAYEEQQAAAAAAAAAAVADDDNDDDDGGGGDDGSDDGAAATAADAQGDGKAMAVDAKHERKMARKGAGYKEEGFLLLQPDDPNLLQMK